MNASVKFMIGGVLILGSAALLMASSIKETGTAWYTTTELFAKVDTHPQFAGVGVKVGAIVVPGSIVRAPNGRDITFSVTDGVKPMRVQLNSIPPDTFTDSAEVIITGSLNREGTFVATELLAKCASRFEAAPDMKDPKYRETPGYKAAKKVGA